MFLLVKENSYLYMLAMENSRAREFLERLIHARRENYDALSRLIGRNPSYIQQYIKRGTPRKLSETDRRTLARYFGADEQLLCGPADTAHPALAGPHQNSAERKRQRLNS